ncbi:MULTISPECIES: TetR/AcrR family transcriptional regulator [unclassified Pseudofrankia]|uniref:TetR/AcrR family transcriptional regulator n=1 Tax=unclassified Pseudofrankia TaxID=2994372 RepID=UPI0008DA47F7|nr:MULTISPECIES: TetR/AcrR family transcriptional regulator [unclassified Pseudofrankia]MDT3444396.1 TetR/AcrR family transcriptional regulator [Pseudofrankia sp. BMG5.37]OHV56474.1 hypothetical protein BCD48_08390 [Pseudofrankia sp. BMG5.36]
MKNDVAPSARSKRELILRIAAEEFGRHGFDATKWADIAKAAGIGNTALYHYFETKTHCLFTLMLESWESWFDRWSKCLNSPEDAVASVLTAVSASFNGPKSEMTQNRLLANEQGKLSSTRGSGREEEVRLASLRTARKVEALWVDFLSQAMEAGSIPRQDPTLLAHAIIGLLQSVWNWYRPEGRVTSRDLDAFYGQAVRNILRGPEPG